MTKPEGSRAPSDVSGSTGKMADQLMEVYRRLLERYGPQGWWPADTPFEVMVGAVLTQATSWRNVEKAIANLESADVLNPAALRSIPELELARLLYPAGYYNAKARKLKALAGFLGEECNDDVEALARYDTDTLRAKLLEVHGIGEETADDILLYSAGKPVFVVDAFTKRLFIRLGLAPEAGSYSTYQELFMDNLTPDASLFGEYHALIVTHAKDICKKRPLCDGCCLLDVCPTGKANIRTAGTA